MKSFASLSGLAVLLTLATPSASTADPDAPFYLPTGIVYDTSVPTPRSVLGYVVGEWHVRHDQLATYMRVVAETSDRVKLEVTGRTHEQRPLLMLTISSPENLARLEEIRQAHLALSDPSVEAPNTTDMPVVVNLSYSVHGNEASGSNAALLVAYYLAAATGDDIERLLDNAIILLDPSLNPDGLARFAQWANMHRGRVLMADPNHREHREGWPNGRTNHYWFDLNRDWLLAQHPESHARLEQFHRWRPNVLIDVHEMGASSSYFFQPGVPNRKNPLTPEKNVRLTEEIAEFHAEALDSLGSLYYSEETFDDFYYGKGSTYPDAHGSVGILFEQASIRGHLRSTSDGDLSFPFAIRNQLTTTLSTLSAAFNRRQQLLDYQREFFEDSTRQARADQLAGWIFGESRDPARRHHFLELLLRHRVVVHDLGESVEADGTRFEPGSAYLVPADQPQALLARTLFERQVEFADSTFYDVSTWTAPLAFDMPYAELRRGFGQKLIGERVESVEWPSAEPPVTGALAYAFEWHGYYAPRALNRLLKAGVRARVATRSFTPAVVSGDAGPALERGTIVVPMGIQSVEAGEIRRLLEVVASKDGLDVHSISTGLTPEGVDLGSPSLKPLKSPRVALVVGGGVDTYAAGEIWHLLDYRHEMALSLLEKSDLKSYDLGKYSHLILVDGNYGDLPANMGQELWSWVRGGGNLIALQRAIPWVDAQVRRADDAASVPLMTSPVFVEGDSGESVFARRPYEDHEKDRAAQLISGAIFEVEVDVTHPLAYGYLRPNLPVFRNREVFLGPESDPYITVTAYSQEPLLSGYISDENLGHLQGTPAITARKVGRGAIVRMADAPSFRAFWYGTDKLLMNAILFSPILEDTARPPRGRRRNTE